MINNLKMFSCGFILESLAETSEVPQETQGVLIILTAVVVEKKKKKMKEAEEGVNVSLGVLVAGCCCYFLF